MINIFVYAADQSLAEQTVQRLKEAGADQVEVLAELKIPGRPPKEHRYLFICETPAEKLSELALRVLSEEEYAQELAKWFETQSGIANVAAALKKRVVVATRGQLNRFNHVIDGINEKFATSLKANESATQDDSTVESVLAYLVQNLIHQTPPLKELSIQINTLAGIEDEPIHETDALTGYRLLHEQKVGLNSQIRQLHSAVADMTALRDAQAKAAAENQKQVDALILENGNLSQEKTNLLEERKTLTSELADAKEESDMLLLQLHTVQEELEHYFLKLKGLEERVDQLGTRWHRLLKRQPGYFDYDSVDVIKQEETGGSVFWSVKGLHSLGISKPVVELETFIESGVMGVRFQKFDINKQPTLHHWPTIAKNLTSIDCIPVGQGETRTLRAGVLMGLSGSDWNLLKLLPEVIERVLTEGTIKLDNEEAFRNGLAKFKQWIERVPDAFRCDTVALKQNKVNPDYEHIWLVFNGAYFASKYWPKLEVRLGAAHIRPGKFTHTPKLEFPLHEDGSKPFHSWYEESYDETGPKLEIRFDLKKNIFDTQVWANVEAKDRLLLQALINALPAQLDALENYQSSISRPIDQWRQIACSCANTLKNFKTRN